jgi:hypothetical protein
MRSQRLQSVGGAAFSGDPPFGQSLAPARTLQLSSSSVGHALACHGELSSPKLFLDKLKHVPPGAARGILSKRLRIQSLAPIIERVN